MQSETAYARQLFLFGEGKMPPVKNVKRLAQLSGAAESTLHRWTAKWKKESEELAMRSENSSYTIALSSEMLAQHKTEIDFLATQVEKLRLRLKKTVTTSPNYPVYLGCYKTALDKWEKSSGIMAHYDTAAAAMRETAKAKARAEAKRSEESQGTGVVLRKVSKDRFDMEG